MSRKTSAWFCYFLCMLGAMLSAGGAALFVRVAVAVPSWEHVFLAANHLVWFYVFLFRMLLFSSRLDLSVPFMRVRVAKYEYIRLSNLAYKALRGLHPDIPAARPAWSFNLDLMFLLHLPIPVGVASTLHQRRSSHHRVNVFDTKQLLHGILGQEACWSSTYTDFKDELFSTGYVASREGYAKAPEAAKQHIDAALKLLGIGPGGKYYHEGTSAPDEYVDAFNAELDENGWDTDFRLSKGEESVISK